MGSAIFSAPPWRASRGRAASASSSLWTSAPIRLRAEKSPLTGSIRSCASGSGQTKGWFRSTRQKDEPGKGRGSGWLRFSAIDAADKRPENRYTEVAWETGTQCWVSCKKRTPKRQSAPGFLPAPPCQIRALVTAPLPRKAGRRTGLDFDGPCNRVSRRFRICQTAPAFPEGSADAPSKDLTGLSWQHRSAVGVCTLPAAPLPNRLMTGEPTACLPGCGPQVLPLLPLRLAALLSLRA